MKPRGATDHPLGSGLPPVANNHVFKVDLKLRPVMMLLRFHMAERGGGFILTANTLHTNL